MQVSVERTPEAVTITLPPTVDHNDIQYLLDFFAFQEAVSKSQATQEEIDALAKEVKSGWWERNKHRFEGKEGFENL
jgi:hypothetical protein